VVYGCIWIGDEIANLILPSIWILVTRILLSEGGGDTVRKTFGIALILISLAGFSQLFADGNNCITDVVRPSYLAFLVFCAPEINAGTAASALALLSGGLLLIKGRRKK